MSSNIFIQVQKNIFSSFSSAKLSIFPILQPCWPGCELNPDHAIVVDTVAFSAMLLCDW